jgi:hypothetical protein
MTRTPAFYAILVVHTLFGLAAIVAPLVAYWTTPGSDRHRRAGWWFVQSVAGLFVTTCALAAIRYTYFLFVIGFVAWYAAHLAWLEVARPADRTYLASPLARHVQHDLAIVLGAVLAALSLATLVKRDLGIIPGGVGLGVQFVYGALLTLLGWAGRVEALAALSRAQRHLLYVGVATTATYSEFFADITNLFMTPTAVWLTSWIAPAAFVACLVARRIGLRDLRALVPAIAGLRVTARAGEP